MPGGFFGIPVDLPTLASAGEETYTMMLLEELLKGDSFSLPSLGNVIEFAQQLGLQSTFTSQQKTTELLSFLSGSWCCASAAVSCLGVL